MKQRGAGQARKAQDGNDARAAGQVTLSLPEVINAAERLVAAGNPKDAVDLYRLWLNQAGSAPGTYAAHFNLGVVLANMQDHDGAQREYRTAMSLQPDFIQGYLNLGTVLERQGLLSEAIAEWRQALSILERRNDAERGLWLHALNNLGRTLEIQKQYCEAEKMLTRSLELDPDQPEVITHWVHLRQKQCEWPIYAPVPGVAPAALREHTSALALLSATEDPAEQLAAARRFVEKKVNADVPRLAPAAGYRHSRLRVGYLSSDLCSHAVSILTAELYELHDRSKVEVYAFCWSREDGSPLRKRVVSAMDHHVRIGHLTDEQAAQCIRDHEIDILVDLHGLTLGTRPNILAFRPAPVQVTWLGFPGTTGLPGIDYVIADRYVLPESLAPHFSEKPLYMPQVFQINDRKRAVGAAPTRQDSGLPEHGFVFCSFNNNFKITEKVFSAWMRILARVPDSVLWLVSDTPETEANLRRAAQERGIAPERLVFAARVAPEQYLGRFKAADLFLDTFPFNAGTTASDALWAGLPLLTLSGETFASRMAGSLLRAAELPELVASDLQQYEDLAVSLAHDSQRVAALKQRLQDTRATCALFDTPRFVRDLEEQFMNIAVRADDSIKQTPINEIHNVDVLNLMRPDFARIVEVGSSSGALARAYRAVNPSVRYTGIEIDADYAEASRRHCHDVIHGNAEHLSDAQFDAFGDADCWVFADALEHLYDPWKLLRRIRGAAKGQVEVIACIPNAQNWALQSCLNGGQFMYQDSGLLDRTHIRWFTRTTILHLFASTGFQVVAMTARQFQSPDPSVIDAISRLAAASGHDPAVAAQDAMAFQYVVRAVSV